MAKRCEHCVYWRDTVFKGESASGWGVWWGDCAAGVDRGPNAHSLMLACDGFRAKPTETAESPMQCDHRQPVGLGCPKCDGRQ